MVRAQNPFQFLYVSRLATGCTWEVVKEIVAIARLHNPAHAITGALLFDGERFCQLIEGSEADVQALLSSIRKDTRHTGMRPLLIGHSAIGRTTQRWVSGYSDSHELEKFDTDDGPREMQALDAFLAVLQTADVD